MEEQYILTNVCFNIYNHGPLTEPLLALLPSAILQKRASGIGLVLRTDGLSGMTDMMTNRELHDFSREVVTLSCLFVYMLQELSTMAPASVNLSLQHTGPGRVGI